MAPSPTRRRAGGEVRTTRELWTDFAHTGPSTMMGKWLRTFWHPVYRSQDLANGRAAPIRIMSEDYTLYRGTAPSPLAGEGGKGGEFTPSPALPHQGGGGKAHLLAFRCAHRGTQLSTGWVEGDNLRCFYHGWMYDGTGQCLEQPAEPEPFCEKVRIKSYPVEEYLGLIFAYLGEGEPPPLMRFPEFEDTERGILDTNTSMSPCNYFNLIDNDPVHIYFVHRTFNADQGRADIPRVECEETDYGYVTRAVDSQRSWAYHCYIPNLVHGRRDGYPKGEAIQWRVPVDDEHCVSLGVNLLYLHGEEADAYRARRSGRNPVEAARRVNEVGAQVLRGGLHVQDVNDRSILFNVQDYVAQVGLGAIVDLEAQHLGREDAATIMLRNICARELRALASGRPLKHWRRAAEPLLLGNVEIAE